LKRVLAISFITNFIYGGIVIAVPLALLNRGVSLVEIGAILSIMPAIFLVVRVIFAAIADQIGWSPIFLVNTISMTTATIIYSIAKSPLEFAIGKIFEGITMSAYWAVSRTATYELSPGRETSEATRVIATVSIGGAIGGATTGLLMNMINVDAAFPILTAISTIQLYPTILLWKTGLKSGRLNILKALKALDLRGRNLKFWYTSIIMAINSLSRYPLFNMILPVYMAKILGYDYMGIGFMTAIYNITSSLTIYLTLNKPLNVARAITQSTVYFIACIGIAKYTNLLPILMIVMAFADGLGAKFYEAIIVKATRNRHETISVDIGVLHIPMRIFESTALIIFGLIVEILGYDAAFIISGLAYISFSILSYIETRKE
jgi:MFS family permease